MTRSSTSTRTSAFDCLVRGFYSLRANWELVPLMWVQQVLLLVLLVASVVAFFLPFGFGTLSLEALEGSDPEVLLAELLADPGALLVPLLVGLVVSTLLGILAILVYGWFQGGLMAVLLAGERQAVPGEPRDWRLFRTFEWHSFAGWGRRLMWRYFWLFHLYLAVLLGLMLAVLLVLVLAVWGSERWGSTAVWSIGCGGAIPLGFAVVVTALWYLLAQAALAREGSGVGPASRRALEVLGRRPGAVLLLAAVFFAASLLVSIGTAPFSMITVSLAEQSLLAYCLGQALIYLVQMGISGILGVAFYGAAVALVHSVPLPERRSPTAEEGA